jgi:glycosyltransferase involved in cell wall biosynthesis
MAALISVCVPTYNGAPYVAEQLRSILASPRVGEVIVSDDGSTDATREVVRALGDPRLRLVDGPRRGLVRNVEHLLALAAGEIVFLADQDDVWLPGKVETMLERLGDADLAVSDCRVVDAALHELHPSFFALRRSGPGLLRNLARNSYLGCCMALRRPLLERALPFPHGVPMHDWWLGLVAQAFGRVVFIDEPLVLYRRHGANASSTAEASRAGWATRLRWRATLAAALLQRWLGGRRAGAAPLRHPS